MRTLYLDTFSGISGDMMLGLLVDLGVDLAKINDALRTLPISGYCIEKRLAKRHGIGGTKVDVVCDEEQPARSWQSIDTMIAQGDLKEAVKESARKTFRNLGEAEAHVHQIELNAVHFHEVGAVDAIVDIVGSAIGLEMLAVDEVLCAPLPLSSGMTTGSHGVIPLPAPATLQILAGHPVCNASSDKELVTPTGAAIAASVASFSSMPEMTIERTGYGVGGWDLEDRPNLLRGIIGTRTNLNRTESDLVTVIETHIDDSPAEWLGSLLDRLLEAGALDAGFCPLQMKKNRPGTRLTVIAKPTDVNILTKIILHESSAIGVRMHDCRRMKLRRESASVIMIDGQADVKLVYEKDKLLRITPEYESCLKLAKTSGKTLPEVYRMVAAAANHQYGLED